MKKIFLILIFLILITACSNLLTSRIIDDCSFLSNSYQKDDCYLQKLRCSKIQSPSLRDSCITKIALIQENLAICNLIPTLTKFYCYEKIAEKTNNSEICPQINNTYWSDICYKHFAEKTDNQSLCFKITHSGDQKDCLYNIALSKNQPSLCLDLEETQKRKCLLKIALNLNSTQPCQHLNQTFHQDLCILKIAKTSQNSSFCQEISFHQLKQDCLEKTA